jgi:mannan endo-1,4-beta-mannosidase
VKTRNWTAAVLAISAALAVGCGNNPGFAGEGSVGRPLISPASTQTPGATDKYFGVYEPQELRSYAPVHHFGHLVGRQPDLVLSFNSWAEAFPASFADLVWAHHATPLIQINPRGISLRAIAAGVYDAHLRAYASQVRGFGHRVVIGFAHEMNGTWYSWGYRRTPARTWVAAWRHLVTVFRQEGARNVIWLWTVNHIDGTGIPNPRPWWPGARYVSWVGVDSYYYTPQDTFATVFGATIAAVRQFSDKPILLAETAMSPGADPTAQFPALVAQIRAQHLLGLVYFDADAIYRWRLEGRPAVIAAFRRALIATG